MIQRRIIKIFTMLEYRNCLNLQLVLYITVLYITVSFIYLPTPPLGQDMTQGQFLSILVTSDKKKRKRKKEKIG